MLNDRVLLSMKKTLGAKLCKVHRLRSPNTKKFNIQTIQRNWDKPLKSMHSRSYSGQHRESFSSLLCGRLTSKILIKSIIFASPRVRASVKVET